MNQSFQKDLFFKFLFLLDFIYLFDRERQPVIQGAQAGEWERKEQAPSGGAPCGARSQDSGITP